MTDDYSIQVSFKTPSQTLINLRAGDEQEISELIDVLGRQLQGIGGVEKVLAAMDNLYTGLSPIAALEVEAERKASAPASQQGQQRQASTPVASGDTPICAHGPMVFRKGITKTGRNAGKAWSGFMCSGPQGQDQCSPLFDKVARDSA